MSATWETTYQPQHVDPAHLIALTKLYDEIAVSCEASGINGRGHDIANIAIWTLCQLGWTLTPPAPGKNEPPPGSNLDG